MQHTPEECLERAADRDFGFQLTGFTPDQIEGSVNVHKAWRACSSDYDGDPIYHTTGWGDTPDEAIKEWSDDKN